MTPPNNKWIWVALAAVALFLTWAVFRGCGEGNVHRSNKSQVDSAKQATNTRYKRDSSLVKEYQTAISVLENDKRNLKVKVAALETQLNASGKQANKIAYKVVQAKVERDTIRYVANCDSLVTAVADLTNILDHYQEEIRQTVNNYEATNLYKDSIISIQGAGLVSLKASHDFVSGKYDLLYRDYGKLVKRNKRERTLTRILAGATLVLGGIVLSK
jgi:hypothetical protein